MLKRFFKDIKKYYKYLIYSTKATLKTEVSESYLAWIWWVLEPFCYMLIYTFIAQVVFKTSKDFFPVFIFLGLTVWNFFNKNMIQSVRLLKVNKSIVTRIYIPKYVFLIQAMMVNGFKMLISLALSFALMAFYRVPISYTVVYMLPYFLMLFLITFGIGILLMHFGVYVNDLNNMVNILLKLVFYFSGVFYDVAVRVPAPYGQWMLQINPVAVAMDGLRNSLLYRLSPNWIPLLVWSAVGLLLSAIGVVTVYKNENNYGKML